MKEIEIVEVKKEDWMDNYYTEWGTLDKFFDVPDNEIADVDLMLDCYFDNNCYGEIEKLRIEKIDENKAEMEYEWHGDIYIARLIVREKEV